MKKLKTAMYFIAISALLAGGYFFQKYVLYVNGWTDALFGVSVWEEIGRTLIGSFLILAACVLIFVLVIVIPMEIYKENKSKPKT